MSPCICVIDKRNATSLTVCLWCMITSEADETRALNISLLALSSLIQLVSVYVRPSHRRERERVEQLHWRNELCSSLATRAQATTLISLLYSTLPCSHLCFFFSLPLLLPATLSLSASIVDNWRYFFLHSYLYSYFVMWSRPLSPLLLLLLPLLLLLLLLYSLALRPLSFFLLCVPFAVKYVKSEESASFALCLVSPRDTSQQVNNRTLSARTEEKEKATSIERERERPK